MPRATCRFTRAWYYSYSDRYGKVKIMAKSSKKRGFLAELLFWVALLGVDALAMYLIHRNFGRWSNYRDTMPIMLPVGAFVPLLAVVLRYFPKKKGARVAGIVVALVLGVVIGQVALRGFYGEHPFIIEAFYGPSMELLTDENLEDMTGTEYAGGVAVSREVDLGARKGTYHGTNALIPTFDYRAVKDAPEPEDYMQMRFYYADGSEREALLYTDGRWEYIKEPGVGIWRAKLGTGSGDVADYTWWRELCIDMDFQATFMNPLETGETPTTHPDYNGGEKAVWIDWTIENSWTDELGMKGSWTGHSYNDYNFDHDTPEGYVPERANEVRWLFVKERTSHSYVGYWYEVGTGRKVSDSYENTYSVTAYDLVTGEKQTMDDSDSIGKCMEQYFGLSDEAAVME